MSSDLRTAQDLKTAPIDDAAAPAGRRATVAPLAFRGTGAPGLAEDSRLAVEIRGLVNAGTAGSMDEARDQFGALVTMHQRRATRIAYQYLRDAAEADEAVQDAFVKVFSHIASYREAWPFEVWFTRILINGCLDRRKARMRRDRWFASTDGSPASANGGTTNSLDTKFAACAATSDPEHRLLARERRSRIASAIDRLDGRQRTVFMLCHYGDCTPREVSVMTGLNESTVRVHLFRAARKLRGLLGGKP
jgi:RNA polymerase sigma-70 factor (ECF subfamily)